MTHCAVIGVALRLYLLDSAPPFYRDELDTLSDDCKEHHPQ
ncbi:hypothetical protein RIB2604_00100330 [Aspergillus luchuensis]|uniref:Uncharacterized protein n=1 Tax=Aspergillus kawachii TaxID=1069201 RepID=A0A146EXJ4_ASPKA|nr:hypothetical protein RIB2604_00100330 [Aspergillus luchuensis]